MTVLEESSSFSFGAKFSYIKNLFISSNYNLDNYYKNSFDSLCNFNDVLLL